MSSRIVAVMSPCWCHPAAGMAFARFAMRKTARSIDAICGIGNAGAACSVQGSISGRLASTPGQRDRAAQEVHDGLGRNPCLLQKRALKPADGIRLQGG